MEFMCSSPYIFLVIKSRKMRGAGHVVRMGERRGAYGVLVGKPEGKRPLGRPRHRWEDNIKMDLRIKGWYWPQGLLSMPIDNNHKSWETPSDKTSVSSVSKSDSLTSSIVIPGQCNFSSSREERMKASPRRLKTETFG